MDDAIFLSLSFQIDDMPLIWLAKSDCHPGAMMQFHTISSNLEVEGFVDWRTFLQR